MRKARRYLLLIVLVTIVVYFAVLFSKYLYLTNDSKLNELISRNVAFDYVVLEETPSPSTSWRMMVDMERFRDYQWTWYIRDFTAWRYDPTATEMDKNQKIVGWVDMNGKIVILAYMKGDGGLY